MGISFRRPTFENGSTEYSAEIGRKSGEIAWRMSEQAFRVG
jgi:hypothetical protein